MKPHNVSIILTYYTFETSPDIRQNYLQCIYNKIFHTQEHAKLKVHFSIATWHPSTARIVQWYSAGLWAGWLGVRIPPGDGNVSLHHHVQTGSGVHPNSYLMGTRNSFPGGKVARAWSSPLIYSPISSVKVQYCVELHFHSSNVPSWRCA
jgi:hypothetical protein